LQASTVGNIARIKHEREELAREFFDRYADDFREQQDLIAPFDQYADGVTDLLLQTEPEKHQQVLEIGPGEGEFLPTLAGIFHRVTAIDISKEMLEKAEALIRQQKLKNVTLLKADTADAVQQQIRVERVVCNMVLHHVPSPADVFH